MTVRGDQVLSRPARSRHRSSATRKTRACRCSLAALAAFPFGSARTRPCAESASKVRRMASTGARVCGSTKYSPGNSPGSAVASESRRYSAFSCGCSASYRGSAANAFGGQRRWLGDVLEAHRGDVDRRRVVQLEQDRAEQQARKRMRRSGSRSAAGAASRRSKSRSSDLATWSRRWRRRCTRSRRPRARSRSSSARSNPRAGRWHR